MLKLEKLLKFILQVLILQIEMQNSYVEATGPVTFFIVSLEINTLNMIYLIFYFFANFTYCKYIVFLKNVRCYVSGKQL